MPNVVEVCVSQFHNFLFNSTTVSKKACCHNGTHIYLCRIDSEDVFRSLLWVCLTIAAYRSSTYVVPPVEHIKMCAVISVSCVSLTAYALTLWIAEPAVNDDKLLRILC